MSFAPRTLLVLALTTALGVPALAQTQIQPTDPLVVIEQADIPGDFSAALAEAQAGRDMFLAGEHAAALALLRPLADAGNPAAQNIVGISLTDLNGAYGPYDAAEGFRYLLAAGAQGFAPAMHNLGDTYEEEHPGFAPDLEQSFRWYLAAAELGYVTAFYNAGYALVNGYGIPEDPAAGRVWVERALDGPEGPVALGLLGDMAYYGLGQDEDLAQALDFYLQSAAAGNAEAAFFAAYQYYWGEGTEVNLGEARRLLEQAVAGDVTTALVYLALVVSEDGEGHAADPDRAFALAQAGDAAEDGFAASVLGDFHRLGIGTPVDLDLARAANLRGQARGDAASVYQLGDMAYFGLGEPVDHARAISFYEAALAIFPEHGESLYSLAYMRMRGEGGPVDIAGATQFMERAIAVRDELAMIEAIELFGSPTYAGPQSDPVRARAHCHYAEAKNFEERDAGDLADHLATCARLAAELSAADQVSALAMAEELRAP
jgi:TPR repeat protein